MAKKKLSEMDLLSAPVDETPPYQFPSAEDLLNQEPSMDSKDWADWIMGQFEQDELNNGLPNVAGLRRVAQRFLGPIVRSVGKLEQAPSVLSSKVVVNDKTVHFHPAVSSYEIDFLWMREDERKGRIVTYGDVGSCWEGNCDSPLIARFLPETATTRSEARCLRKALGLKAIAAEEQIGAVAPNNDNINSPQILFIDAKCRDMGVDVVSFVNAGKRKYQHINDVSYDVALSMTEALGDYEREGLPDKLRGKPYDASWRERFCR